MSGEQKERTEWHRVVIYNEAIGRIAEQYLKKEVQFISKVNFKQENGQINSLVKIDILLKLLFKGLKVS